METPHQNAPKPVPIDVDRIDLDKMREKTTEMPGLLPYAHTSGSAIIRPEDMNQTLARSLTAMDQQTEMQMDQIMAQMHMLAAQAKAIQDRKRISERIYQADMRFEALIGHTYYLYQKEGRDLVSLVAPAEWGRSGRKSLTYLATVRLLADHTWDVLDLAPEAADLDITS
jgi:hypothetical protein